MREPTGGPAEKKEAVAFVTGDRAAFAFTVLRAAWTYRFGLALWPGSGFARRPFFRSAQVSCGLVQGAAMLVALGAATGCATSGARDPVAPAAQIAAPRAIQARARAPRPAAPPRAPRAAKTTATFVTGDAVASSLAPTGADDLWAEAEAAASAGAEGEAPSEAAAALPAIGASASDGRCPAEMALVDGRVCVDRWEASLVVHMPGVGERPWSPFQPIDDSDASVRAVSRPGTFPQGYISGKQAKRACMASGKRLCKASEWERACRGPRNTTFPYGDTRRAGVCNDDVRDVHPVAEAAAWVGLQPDRWWTEGMNLPLINQLPNSLARTGARAGCTNEYGVFDMVGNLHEWIDDPDGTFRGGYYMDTTRNGDGCSYDTTAHDFNYHDYSTGFRCCMDPDPVE